MKHKSVLLKESIDNLNIKVDGVYVDATLGFGGHSLEILKRINKGFLFAFDQDSEAIEYSTERLKDYKNFKIIKSNFANMKECLLSEGRNSHLTKEQIEEVLCTYLNCSKVLWIPNGIYNDETNGHVDNICNFVRPGVVVLAWTDDENDPQYAISKAAYDYLSNETDAQGRKLEIHKLYVPSIASTPKLSSFVIKTGEGTYNL